MNTYDISATVRGLICYQNDTKVMIGNPSTGQFIALLRVKTVARLLFSLLGYDPVNDLYKVLCIMEPDSRRYVVPEYHVFTLGPNQKWRKIACKHPHDPSTGTKKICINGIVYYAARIKGDNFLICFNVTSEDFSVVKLPQYAYMRFLVNYGGKIAFYGPTYKTTLDLWVLADAERQKWSKVSHLIPSWTDLVKHTKASFMGTLSTGQLIFAPFNFYNSYSYFLISHDPKENTTKKVEIEGIGKGSPVQVYFDHVENPMVLYQV